MRKLVCSATTAAGLAVLVGMSSCPDEKHGTVSSAAPSMAVAGEVADACAGDSLRPATAAPAPGLWLYDGPTERVAAMIGPQREDGRSLAVTRLVATVEMRPAGDTIRHVAGAAIVTLELLPRLGEVASNESARFDSGVNEHPAATYAVSPRVRLAAYESCVLNPRDPRIRYLRRNAAGKIITDVLLHRTSQP